MFGICREAFPDVWEASRMSGSVRKALPDVQKTLPDVPEGWEDLPKVREALLVVRESSSEAFPNVREWSGIYPRCLGGTTGCPVVVGWHFWM